MKKIPLTQGFFALVDDADFVELSKYKWYASKTHKSVYARRKVCVAGKMISILMHRVIIGDAANGLEVDHRDGDGLNNQRDNLRACTRGENARNIKPRPNKTGLKGVRVESRLIKPTKKYSAQIRFNGKQIHLGLFITAEQAHAAYCEAAKRLHGEFASF